MNPAPDILVLQAELMGRFADDVAHEVRNPLNALVINLEVLRRRVSTGDAETALGRIDVLEQEVRRVHMTVERLIALLRPARPGEPTTDVAAAFDDVIPLLALRAAALRTGFQGPDPIDLDVRMARDRLRFVILDAGMAAFDRVGSGGHLSCVAASVTGFCSISLLGRAADASLAPDSGSGAPRLARAILRDVGGSVDVQTTGDDRFEIRLSVPAVA